MEFKEILKAAREFTRFYEISFSSREFCRGLMRDFQEVSEVFHQDPLEGFQRMFQEVLGRFQKV